MCVRPQNRRAARGDDGAAVIEPIAERFWPAAKTPEGANEIAGNVWVAVRWLLLVWTFAAVGEEVAYRGYLLTRGAEVIGKTTPAYWISVVLVTVLFGYGHYYKGPTGVIDSGMAGLVLGAAYMAAGRNLWASVLAHGFFDTIGIVLAFWGWDA